MENGVLKDAFSMGEIRDDGNPYRKPYKEATNYSIET
jgi:hypothetical protein